jgi:putative membrane protein
MGFLFHLWDATFPLMLAMTPYTILGTAILGFLPDVVTRNRKLLLWAAGTFAITLFLEILGVATGAVFGSYTYGPTLGFPVMDVPLLIGINWTLIIMGAAMLVERLTNNPWQVALGTAAITVVFDWIMEPVAIALDYWSWSSSTIPLQNYIAWFVIAFVFATIFSRMKLKTASPIPSLIVVVQALFFSLLRLLVI